MNPTFHMSCFCCQISKTFCLTQNFSFSFRGSLTFSSAQNFLLYFLVELIQLQVFCFVFFFNLSGGSLLYNIGWFLPYINMNRPWVYMCRAILNPLPPPSPPYPSGLCQSLGFGCPASCIELALVVQFTQGNGHVSVLYSQIIPPSCRF